jgi:hypothetical protein
LTQLLPQKCKQLALIVFKLLLKGLAQVIIPVAVKQKLEQQMLNLRRCHLPEQLAILPNRCVIGFHKTSGVLGKVLIKPVADPDAAFAEVTGVIRAEKILEVLSLPLPPAGAGSRGSHPEYCVRFSFVFSLPSKKLP